MVEEKNFIVGKRERKQSEASGRIQRRERSRLKMAGKLRGKRGREEREKRGEGK